MEKRNKIERLKAACTPALYAKALEKIHWENPSEADRFYLKNYGIYNIKLRPDQWMLRLRSDGGILSPVQLYTIAECARHYGLKLLLTARAQIELHGITASDIYPLWQQLNKEGIHTYQTFTDNFRAIVTDPLNGLAEDTVIQTVPLIAQIQAKIYAKAEWLGTIPRKFNTALIGNKTPSFNPWGNDLLFALAQKEGQWGFNIYLGGKNSEVAQDTDLFCLPEDTPELFLSIAKMYHTHGLRGSRAKVRLYHLIEAVGMTQVRQWIADHHPHPLSHAGTLCMQSSRTSQTIHCTVQRYGRWGELSTEAALKVSKEAQQKKLPLRLTPHQELWLISPEKSEITESRKGYTPVTVCAGSRYCPLSLWDMKEDMKDLPLDKLQKQGISLGFSGCLKGCGRHYHNDLGMIGLRTSNYGVPERAVRLFLGALESPHPAPARMLYYVVPTRILPTLLDLIMEDFHYSRLPTFEQYSDQILRLYSDDFLRLWYMVRQRYNKTQLPYETFFDPSGEERLISEITRLEGFPEAECLYDRMRILSHQLWDIQ